MVFIDFEILIVITNIIIITTICVSYDLLQLLIQVCYLPYLDHNQSAHHIE